MYRIDDVSAATSLPAPEAAGSEGYYTEGNPVAGVPATNVRASWLNMIQEELCSILAAAGIARSKTSYNQVNAALQKMYSPVVGTMRNAAMSVAAASATAIFTADQIVVATAFNGQTYILPSFSKTINLATTGAGGMDTGAAPASGYVALYAIYNPTTGASALLAKNATSAVQPNVYGGANMPAGYTASALVSVWPTNGSGQFVPAYQVDRKIWTGNSLILSTSTQQPSFTSLSISGAVPPNAKSIGGLASVASSASATTGTLDMAGSVSLGAQQFQGQTVTGFAINATFSDIPLITQQTVYYVLTVSTGTMTANMYVSSYTI
ncbi:hypothetical protein WM11_31485 [Burkholderia ubonensis]|uniref:hypothetical protein n=1 Tax=Burkholderia ubonensis TaxID=101571 RepID=UPI000759962B|nr:hypothetical protein [Burkholderia ubonensis]KVR46381.1 hypothetical protein WK18_12705 [Burkholderia ubonensis]KWB74505.1 hypothetical protein WL41_15235 [Burkholderia ubonensis]KWC20037.1 hypothetical protein WL46_21935 [Burkholderia ubonensis]KWK12946.1 hypothetical protein WM11_31485 [Burkholderia ubonensis]KWK47822.1 hypothetical protein WM14_06220 [Burkholderia ubonensis]